MVWTVHVLEQSEVEELYYMVAIQLEYLETRMVQALGFLGELGQM